MAQEKLASQDVQQVVLLELRLILEEGGKPAHPIALDDGLDADLGLSSSDLVRLVSNLTAKLGTDPFKRSASITDIRTVGDLCRLYQTLRAGDAGGTGIDTLLGRRRRTVGTSEGPA
jgi:acyl carrier protein